MQPTRRIALSLGMALLARAAAAQDPAPIHVRTFNREYVNWNEVRSRTFAFPEASLSIRQVVLTITLDCPAGGCDPWDRGATVFVKGTDDAGRADTFEIARFITPYGRGCSWTADVTDYRRLLAGSAELGFRIETWIGGNQGWLVTLDFDFQPGVPDRRVIGIRNLWRGSPEYGNPDNPIANFFAERKERIDAPATAAKLRFTVTGHGQGNTDNAAEFARKVHGVLVDGTDFQHDLWRGDCGTNPCSPQSGTWQYERAGWCPGSTVTPWDVDITDLVVPGTTAPIRYHVEAYVNRCRPVAGCTAGNCIWGNCDYDGGSHTVPIYWVESQLIAYGTPTCAAVGPPASGDPPVAGALLPREIESGNVPLAVEGTSAILDGTWSHEQGQETAVSFGPDPSRKFVTTYFRHLFDVRDPAAYSALKVNLRRDDGAVLYLNGTEQLRSNMPSGAIAFGTLASSSVSGGDEDAFQAASIPARNLRAGLNALAVEVHQASITSSDIVFDLELTIPDGAEVLVPKGSVWRFADRGIDLGAAWRRLDFDDSDWERGPAPLGYGNIAGGERDALRWKWTIPGGPADGAAFTTLASGWRTGCAGIGYGAGDNLTELSDMKNHYVAVYLTREFRLDSPASITALTLDILYDDGFAAYLNGVEVARSNLPANPGPSTRATSAISPTWRSFDLKSHLGTLNDGTNRLSVELHSAAPSSASASVHPTLRAIGAGGESLALIEPYAAWRYQPGSAGAPPASWTEAGFDPRASRVTVAFTRPGDYRIRLDLDDGSLSDSTEVTLHAQWAFVRADANGDGTTDISDAVAILGFLFLGDPMNDCEDAADVNDDGVVDISDPVRLLGHLFLGSERPPDPLGMCGEDPTGDELGCNTFSKCP